MKTAAEAVTFLYRPGEPAGLNVTADPAMIAADGSSISVISATVRDGRGDALPAEMLYLTTTLGTLSAVTATTGVSGTAAVTLTAGLAPGTSIVTVTANGALGSVVATTAVTMEVPITGLAAINDSRRCWATAPR